MKKFPYFLLIRAIGMSVGPIYDQSAPSGDGHGEGSTHMGRSNPSVIFSGPTFGCQPKGWVG